MKFGPWNGRTASTTTSISVRTTIEFWAALWNTFVIGSISLVLQCAIALALAFYAYRDPWVKGWRIVFLMPDAVHAFGRRLHFQAGLSRCAGDFGHPDPHRSDIGRQPLHPFLGLDVAGGC